MNIFCCEFFSKREQKSVKRNWNWKTHEKGNLRVDIFNSTNNVGRKHQCVGLASVIFKQMLFGLIKVLFFLKNTFLPLQSRKKSDFLKENFHIKEMKRYSGTIIIPSATRRKITIFIVCERKKHCFKEKTKFGS